LRTLLLQPLVGDFRARQIAVFTGILIIFTTTFLFIRWINAKNVWQLLGVGLLWLILTVSFEIILGRFAAGFDWERILSDYDLSNGGLLSIGLILMFFSPLIVAKIRKII
jgi:hypothetical protein